MVENRTGPTIWPAPPPRAETSWLDVTSPIGRLRIVGNDATLSGIYFENEAEPATAGLEQLDREMTAALAEQLDEYFAGRRREFDVALAVAGTSFQRSVWNALLAIPYGTTATYSQVAASIEHPRAQRAVGSANRRNLFPIIIPCHRVNAHDGKLAGYGGGLERKALLLDLERRGLGLR